MQNVLRTPNERFIRLPAFPFDPYDIDVLKGFEGLRMPYIDEGVQNAHNVFWVSVHRAPHLLGN